MTCFENEYTKALLNMRRIIDRMPEYKSLMSDSDIKELMTSATEQHAKYHAKRMCGLKPAGLGKLTRRRRCKSRK